MKNFVYVSIFILLNIVFAIAQTSADANCPVISVSGPAGIVMPNEPANYTVNLDAAGNGLKLEYVWSVSSGEIIAGQGTPNITVKQPDGSLTVTVEIKGLPDNCPNSASESSIGDLVPQAEKLDEFSGAFSRTDKTGFNKIIEIVENDPNAQLYIINKYLKNTSRRKINNRIKEVTDYLRNAGIATDRIVIVETKFKTDSIEFWFVPAGAAPPTLNLE